MKKIILFFVLFSIAHTSFSQIKPSYELLKEHPSIESSNSKKENIYLTNDTNINILFYHIQVEVVIDSQYIIGIVHADIEITNDNVNTIYFDLDHSFDINSITGNCISYTFEDKDITCNLDGTYNTGDIIGIDINYEGEPRLINNLKSVRYETHGENDEPVIVTLSTPFLAHLWWPCKDGTTDKPDSVYVDITIKDTTINSIPVVAVSNGLLTDVETNGNNKTFKWKHRYPIVPYYVMFTISNYQTIEEIYNSPLGYQMPLIYYVFDEHVTTAQQGIEVVPDAISFFEEKFGQYPFNNEKYGMTQLGFYGAIENQTNTIINQMDVDWETTIVHELAHQWFGDMITCTNWHHCWVNEGFASYTEAMWIEYKLGFQEYQNTVQNFFAFYDSGTLFLQDDTNPMEIFEPIAYKKGAYLLHMLRHVLGDEDFFLCLYNYANDPRFMNKNASTEDFQEICESISKADLSYFFEQWVYDERYPWYYYTFYQDELTNQPKINIEQRQNELYGWREVFTMPMDIKITFSDFTDTTVVMFNNEQNQDFIFDFTEDVTEIAIDPNNWILCHKTFEPNEICETSRDDIFNIYPNPSLDGTFHIDNRSEYGIENIIILDIEGRFIQAIEYRETIDLSNLQKGIYLIKIVGMDIVSSRKISIL